MRGIDVKQAQLDLARLSEEERLERRIRFQKAQMEELRARRRALKPITRSTIGMQIEKPEVHARLETATLERANGPSAKFMTAMMDLLETMKRTHVQCEQCRTNRASHVRRGASRKPTVVCSACSDRYASATPLERKAIQLEIARTR
jgi:hypothetical protein